MRGNEITKFCRYRRSRESRARKSALQPDMAAAAAEMFHVLLQSVATPILLVLLGRRLLDDSEAALLRG